jgi:uroporphyrinogen decarboxylase
MTDRQISQAALDLKPIPRNCAGVIAGGEWFVTNAEQSFGRIKTDPQAMAQVFIKAYETLKPDLIWTGGGLLNYPAHCLGAPIEDASNASPVLTSTAISGLGDLGSLDPEAALANPINQAIGEAVKLVGEAIGQKTALFHTIWGPFTTAARVLGAEPIMMATVTDPDGLSKLVGICTDYLCSICESVLEHDDVLGINLSEPVSSCDMISPVTFRNFVVPALAKMIGLCKDKGKYITIHICGNSTPLLDDIAELAPHGFSIENKVDLADAREKLAGKVCVLGNVSPTGAFFKGTADEVLAESQACLQRWGDAPGYILTNGCDFPKEVPLDNILAMLSVRGL